MMRIKNIYRDRHTSSSIDERQVTFFFIHVYVCKTCTFRLHVCGMQAFPASHVILAIYLHERQLSCNFIIRESHPVSILHKSMAGHYRPVKIADEPITARCRFMKKASWDNFSFKTSETMQNCFLFVKMPRDKGRRATFTRFRRW